MKTLAFDTAMFGCSVAFYDSETGQSEFIQKPMPRGQAEVLVPMVQDVMVKAGVEFTDIDLIATTIGPGAFTGLRIGLATTQGFGLALGKSVVGLTTLEVLAAMFFENQDLGERQILGVLIETKRQDYYCQFFGSGGVPLSEPKAIGVESIHEWVAGKDVVFIGDALERFGADNRAEGYELPDPLVMARLAVRQYEAGEAKEAVPLYLRDADVSVPKKDQRTILEDH